mgnify:CR=1 FL=1|tara:strand:- start:5223 stop:5357 length:135 start_codon:yes stop_codon:yes gene_type:complete
MRKKHLTKKYAKLISFRLLATVKHVDYEWLEKVLSDLIDASNKK